MSFEDFIDNFKDIEGIRVVSFNKNTNSVYYELLEEKTQKEMTHEMRQSRLSFKKTSLIFFLDSL